MIIFAQIPHETFVIILCSLGIQTTTGVVMGGAALGSRNKDAFRTGEEAANIIKSAYKLRACVDRHVQDMLIVLMALADGRSKIKTEQLTMHTQTAIFVAEMMTKVCGVKE